MGLYDRDYYRDRPSEWFTPIVREPVCSALIAITLVVFLFQLSTFNADPIRGPRFGAIDRYGVLEAGSVLRGEPWRLISYPFLGPPGGYGAAALFVELGLLWFFGGLLEQSQGPKRFLGFFMFSAIISGLAFNLANWAAEVPGFGRGEPVITGPGGALTAILVRLAVRDPGRIINFIILPLPIWFFLVFHILQDSIGLFGRAKPPNIILMHLAAGLLGAVVELLPEKKTTRLPPPREAPSMESIPELTDQDHARELPKRERGLDEHLEAKLDAILEKMNRDGYANLSMAEQEFLKETSARLREFRSKSGK